MKKINLSSLSLRNFKGIKDLNISFNKQTSIFGANEAGKTSVFDAFNWLLFGKDSFDRKDFAIKNTVHKELNRQEHEVEGVLLIDDNGREESITLKRIYKEKWSKPKGATRQEYTGNVQEFYWNDVPMQAGEFAAKISELVDETIFKLITNAIYFNTLPWKKRREFLFNLAGSISNNDVAGSNKRFQELATIFSSKGEEGYKTEINAKKKKLKDDLEAIPHRIDELSKSLPEERDFNALRSELKSILNNIADIDTILTDKANSQNSKSEAIQQKQRGIHQLKTSLQDLEFEAHSRFNKVYNETLSRKSELTNIVNTLEGSLKSKNILLKSQQDTKQGLDLRTDNLRNMFDKVNQEELVFDESKLCCPTCKRDFDAEKVEEEKANMRKNFIDDKNRALDEIEEKGKALAAESKKCNDTIQTLSEAIEVINKELAEANEALSNFIELHKNDVTKFDKEAFESSIEYTTILNQVKAAQDEVAILTNKTDPEDNSAELRQQKAELNIQADVLKKEINLEETIKTTNLRIDELKNKETEYANQLAQLEGIEHDIEEFTKAKIDLIESRINGRFQSVTFKMYNYTIGGNPEETCETMYKGVPFGDLNTAGKIWAGIDIINTLSDHYQVYAPIFLDNRESTSVIPFTESQVVNLFVSPEDKKLRVA